jgi:hypothetical protein
MNPRSSTPPHRIRLGRVTPLRVFMVAVGGALTVLFSCYAAAVLILSDPVPIQVAPLDPTLLTA